MKAFILCAGFGSRMGSLTKDKPKCLMQINGETLLERHLKNLKLAGIDEVIINLHHKTEAVEKYLIDNKFFEMQISVSKEIEIMGTGGALLKAKELIGIDPFLLISGDIYTNYSFIDLIKQDWSENFNLSDQVIAAHLLAIGYSDDFRLKDKNSDFYFINSNSKNNFGNYPQFIKPYDAALGIEGFTYSGISIINPLLIQDSSISAPIELWRDYLSGAASNNLVTGEIYLENYKEEQFEQGIFININTQEDVKKVESLLKVYGKTK